MSDDRRYSEDEIAEIFRQAAEAQATARRHLPHEEGLTLAELQRIGQDVGITPAFIARAAAAIDRPETPLPSATYLGQPVSVARTVDLPGTFSDDDWDRLVVDLRETFQATGTIRRDGSLRQWNNGNLRALVEPTDTGHRLHLRTRKGSAQAAILGSLGLVGLGLALLVMLLFAGEFGDDIRRMFVAAMFALGGLGSLGATGVRLRWWVAERGRQMDDVAARAVQRASTPVPERQIEAAPRLDLDALSKAPEEARARRSDRASERS